MVNILLFEYIRRDGKLNLVFRLLNYFVWLDLGFKMYNVYGKKEIKYSGNKIRCLEK